MLTSNIAFLRGFLGARTFKKRESLDHYQTGKLKKILAEHATAFYPSSTSLSDFPIINKQIFMRHFSEVNIARITEKEALSVAMQAEESRDFSPLIGSSNGQLIVGLSSGTSGSRGIFLVSPQESARWAGHMCRRLLPKPYLRRHKIAFFLRANSNLDESVRGRLIDFFFYDLLTPIEEHITQLNQQQPSILIAPAQVLYRLTQSKKIAINPEKIISVAEVLTPEIQTKIATHFNQTIHQVYQCTEGFLAHTCSEGNLHLNEDLVYIEKDWIDKESGRFSPIVTDFNRRTQPIIRYHLDDILRINNTPCQCGSIFTRLKAIEGRCDDTLQARTHHGKPYALYPDFVRRALICIDDIEDYRVQQKGEQLLIALKPLNASTRQSAQQSLQKLFQKHNIKPFSLVFEQHQEQPLHQKCRRVSYVR